MIQNNVVIDFILPCSVVDGLCLINFLKLDRHFLICFPMYCASSTGRWPHILRTGLLVVARLIYLTALVVFATACDRKRILLKGKMQFPCRVFDYMYILWRIEGRSCRIRSLLVVIIFIIILFLMNNVSVGYVLMIIQRT